MKPEAHVIFVGTVADESERELMTGIEPRLMMLHNRSNGRTIDLYQRVSSEGCLNRRQILFQQHTEAL